MKNRNFIKITSFLLVLFTTFFQLTAAEPAVKEIAITFDDSPRAASGYFDGPKRAEKLISELIEHNVGKVVFFSVSSNLNEEGYQRLLRYSEAGHIIANHTHSHPNINETNLQAYKQNFLLAEQKLKQFKTYQKIFRFPFLREGDTFEKRNGMRTLLQERGYINGYVTLNNYDWYIETLFQEAILKGKIVDFDKLSRFYVDVLMESIEYYDEMAISQLGRSPKHVLLLHEIDISALFIGDLVDELRNKGWKIISAESAYSDDIAEFKIAQPLKYNPGRVGEIAKANGQLKDLWHYSLDEKYLEKQFNLRVLNHTP